MLDAATILEDLRVPPGSRLEKVRGDRDGQHRIRVNQQWRVCFRWRTGNAYDVEIVDYHQEGLMPSTKLAPVHPGEVLLEEFFEPMKISQYRLAMDIRVSPHRINEIVRGQRSITADTALRLSRYFGTSERFWLNLHTGHDLEVEKDRLGNRLDSEVLQRAG